MRIAMLKKTEDRRKQRIIEIKETIKVSAILISILASLLWLVLTIDSHYSKKRCYKQAKMYKGFFVEHSYHNNYCFIEIKGTIIETSKIRLTIN